MPIGIGQHRQILAAAILSHRLRLTVAQCWATGVEAAPAWRVGDIDGFPRMHDPAALAKLADARQRIMDQLGQVIVGQNQVIEELLISLFSRGHCLLEGVPGLAKTLLISTLARSMACCCKA